MFLFIGLNLACVYQPISTTTMNFIVPNSSAKLECVEFRENSPRDHYARLILGPVAPGQGVTLGNTFRRLLLNDLPGVAITAAKLNDARTEFVTLPGIRESVVEIFLNLRDVVFFNTFPDVLAPQGTIVIDPQTASQMDTTDDIAIIPNEPRVICAGDMDLPEGVQCVDPTQPIATLMNPHTPFHLTFILEQATGYRVWKKPTQPYGTGFYPPRQTDMPEIEQVKSGVFQPIDGNFMPVKIVNFAVHDGPPHGEYIHFEITTNGSVHPHAAFKHAGAILTEITRATLQDPRPVVGIEEVSTPVATPTNQMAYFETIAIEQLELSLRAYNCLKRAQILTLADLSRESYQSLLALRNFGQKSAEEVTKALETYGIELVQET
jgi:DNA-directed RNA polymerase subunit alpha